MLTAPREAERERAAAPPASTATLQPRGRILLAEDSPDSQRLIAFYLRRGGCEVTTAGTGQMAYEMATSAVAAGTPFDVILMDIQMPELDGCAATAWLRAEGYRGAIVALTAHAMEGDRERCLEAGCDDFLTKPITEGVLLEAVHSRLAARSGADAGA